MAAAVPKHVWTTDAWAKLKAHVPAIEAAHLRDLLAVGKQMQCIGDSVTVGSPPFNRRSSSQEVPRRHGMLSLCVLVLQDADRCAGLVAESDGVCLDYSRQRVTGETMALLHSLAEAANLKGKIADMAAGKRINVTEDRAVMHMALRAPTDAVSCK